MAAVLLVGYGSSVPDISIHKATIEGNIKVVKQHLVARMDVNLSCEKAFFNDSEKAVALVHATSNGYIEIARLLIAKGANVNAKDVGDKTPLDNAVWYKKPEIADLLRKHGVKTSEELKNSRC